MQNPYMAKKPRCKTGLLAKQWMNNRKPYNATGILFSVLYRKPRMRGPALCPYSKEARLGKIKMHFIHILHQLDSHLLDNIKCCPFLKTLS